MASPALAELAAATAGRPVVSIEGVTHRYGKVVALDDISLEIPSRHHGRHRRSRRRRQVDADGAGGRLEEDAGRARSIVLDGDIADARHRRAVGPRIAYMPQGLGKNLYLELSVYDNVDFMARLFGLSPTERTHPRHGAAARRPGSARSRIARPASSRAE